MIRFRLGRLLCFLLTVAYFVMLGMLSKSFDASVRKERATTALATAFNLRKFIKEHNEKQTIHNERLFGPMQSDTLIIVVQVHNRVKYLDSMVGSLSRARHISSALLVFSHDYFDRQIHMLIDSIKFTKVMQIYFPYSNQANPTQFPGDEPEICPQGNPCTKTRDVRFTQIKHHWWWKANVVFNHLACTTNHTGLVLFLEEDHYVAEDFIHMLRVMRKTADRRCPQCEIFSLCPFSKTYTSHIIKGDQTEGMTGLRDLLVPMVKKYAVNLQRLDDYYEDQINAIPTRADYTRVIEIVWFSKIHNMGFAFNRTVWESILAIHEEFCRYNDYNWDFSLLNLSRNRPSGSFKVLMSKGARVFHIGKCGVHYQQPDCDESKIIKMVHNRLVKVRSHMFPERLQFSVDTAELVLYENVRRGNGGWLDQRDHALCRNMTRMQRAQPTKQDTEVR